MSGFALLYRPDGEAVDRRDLARMTEALRHGGWDGHEFRFYPGLGIGQHHFWTTPEAVGELQPLESRPGGPIVLFDGRLDNRGELLTDLRLPLSAGITLSDAALLQRAYSRWGEACFERLLGPFAAVVYDPGRHALLCARDALGDRALFYHPGPRQLLVATEEQALLAHPKLSARLDETTVAGFLGVYPPAPQRTFFAEVCQLPAAHLLRMDEGGLSCHRYWDAPVERRRYRTDAAYAEHFLALLDESVRACLRATTPSAVLMSGGLDSTAVAALAARQLLPKRLTTISWIFKELAGCDERPYIDMLNRCYGTTPIRIPGDDGWPRAVPLDALHNPNQPDGNMFRRLNERAYQAAAAAGHRTLLTGMFGDHLYAGLADWLVDLLAEWRPAEALGELRRLARRYGWRAVWGSPGVRQVGRRLLDTWPGSPAFGARAERPWLTPFARQLLAGAGEADHRGKRDTRRGYLLGTAAAQLSSSEQRFGLRHGVDVRNPYRNRRLVEFALSIPGHQFYKAGTTKFILRQAMAGILPEPVRQRRWQSSLYPLYHRGLAEEDAAGLVSLLSRPDAVWPRYVAPSWLWAHRPDRFHRPAGSNHPEQVVVYRCLSFELWHQQRSASPGTLPTAHHPLSTIRYPTGVE